MPAPLSDENLQRINMTFLTCFGLNHNQTPGHLASAGATRGMGLITSSPERSLILYRPRAFWAVFCRKCPARLAEAHGPSFGIFALAFRQASSKP